MRELIDAVVEQIREDMSNGDFEPLEKLLKYVPVKNLEGFLAEVNEDERP
jgi:hypothetical protein